MTVTGQTTKAFPVIHTGKGVPFWDGDAFALYSVPESFLGREAVFMDQTNHYPDFPNQPNDAFVLAWREHIQQTGYPETFDRVSTSKPVQLHDIVLLSEEIRVPTALRLGGEDVPCPFCSPEKPKFGRGRMAYFPQESVIRFVGHRCAKTHFGENYAAAERQFRRQETARRYIQLWKAVAADKGKIAELMEVLLVVGERVELVRREMERAAPGVCKELYRELSNTAGELRVTGDLGMRDRHGNVVQQTQVIGTGSGLAFLRASFSPVKAVRRAKAALAATEVDLPEWEPMTPEHPATEDILKLGRNLEKSLQDLPDARDAIHDAGSFLDAKNVRLLNRWGSAPSSAYATFEMKMRGKQLIVRVSSFTGRYYATATVPEEKELKVPDAADPAMAWAKEMASNG